MAKAPAFQFYAKDWLSGTYHMSCAERGAYITLLAAQWEDGSLPVEVKRLAMIAQCAHEDFSVIWLAIRDKFPLCEDGFLRNRRLEKERQKQIVHRERQADRGKMGAEVRWKGHKKQSVNSTRHVSAMPAPLPKNGSAFASAFASAKTNTKPKTTAPNGARSLPLPANFSVTPEHRAFAASNGLSPPDEHIGEFRDYWLGNGKRKLDWDATFRNWLRRAKHFNGRTRSQTEQRTAHNLRTITELAAEIDQRGSQGPIAGNGSDGGEPRD